MAKFAIKRTGDADYPRHLKVLLQGPPKSGKTTFITTAPNVLVASCEAGLMSIAHMDVPFTDIESTDQLQQLEMMLRDEKLREAIAKQAQMPKVETIAIDTLDAWQNMLKKEIMAENRRTQMQQADWGVLKERMSEILKRFVSLPMNVIFTVHTSTSQDDEQRMIYAPALQGGIKDEIAGLVDFSLLAFRQRETAPNGAARIAYYLKNEGDQKNPHLGNRAAGRVPEVCAPDFGVLHNAVFSAVKPGERHTGLPNNVTTIVHEAVEPPKQQKAAPVASQPDPDAAAEPEPAPTPAPVPQKSGVPADNPDAPITTEGITMLTKSYVKEGLNPPLNLNEWTLAKGRQIARWFMAWNTDKAAGQEATRDDLIAYLQAMDSFNGEMENVTVGTKAAEKPPAAPEAHEPAGVTPDPDQVEEAALELLKNQLGAVEIGREVPQGTPCAECGKPVDDPDIAHLAQTRFRRPLCNDDYRKAVKAATAA